MNSKTWYHLPESGTIWTELDSRSSNPFHTYFLNSLLLSSFNQNNNK